MERRSPQSWQWHRRFNSARRSAILRVAHESGRFRRTAPFREKEAPRCVTETLAADEAGSSWPVPTSGLLPADERVCPPIRARTSEPQHLAAASRLRRNPLSGGPIRFLRESWRRNRGNLASFWEQALQHSLRVRDHRSDCRHQLLHRKRLHRSILASGGQGSFTRLAYRKARQPKAARLPSASG